MNQNARSKKIYRTLATLAVAAMLASVPVKAEATPTYLDITSQNITETGTYHFSGTATSYVDETLTSFNIYNGSFDADTTTGLFSITGELNSPGSGSQTLLSGSLGTFTDYGFGYYEILISSASGFLNSNASWSGDIIKIDMGAGSGFGSSDTITSAPVPEPATMSLMLLGGSALVGLRRRRKSPTV